MLVYLPGTPNFGWTRIPSIGPDSHSNGLRLGAQAVRRCKNLANAGQKLMSYQNKTLSALLQGLDLGTSESDTLLETERRGIHLHR